MVWAAAAIALVLSLLLVFARARAALVRAIALALFVLALANPSITREDREPLTSVAAVVIDKSPSQAFGDRLAQTEAARAALAERLGRIPGLEVRFVEAGGADGEPDGTPLFSALISTLADVRPQRVAGAIFINDGRVDGVRDKLRVLLVSGEPHAGERTWRNLLKSDASVDLVHFTILRPPEKQDGTPINELSLIAFPTRELFQQKIHEFHLIIFDRYARQGVLPIAYFDNIARYVRGGGAVLVSAGPDYASTTSIWRTPLDSVLPAEPVGVTEKPCYAHLSDMGKRHPVTRGRGGSGAEPPRGSRFFRTVDTRNSVNPPVMTGVDGKPLLFLSRFGSGRVALLLSDHIWLWARGYEGGGPHLDLLRRMSHWLMKQPDLDEEALRLQVQGKDLQVIRQTMADTVSPVTVTSPSGTTKELTLAAGEPGEWRASLPAG